MTRTHDSRTRNWPRNHESTKETSLVSCFRVFVACSIPCRRCRWRPAPRSRQPIAFASPGRSKPPRCGRRLRSAAGSSNCRWPKAITSRPAISSRRSIPPTRSSRWLRVKAERDQADAQLRLLLAGARPEDIRQAEAQRATAEAEVRAVETELGRRASRRGPLRSAPRVQLGLAQAAGRCGDAAGCGEGTRASRARSGDGGA